MKEHQGESYRIQVGGTYLAKINCDSLWIGHYLAKKTKDGGIAINTKKKFKNGHTHVRDISCAFWLCEMAHKKKIPRRSSLRDLQSLIRISDCEEYKQDIQDLFDARKKKGAKQYYYNRNTID